MKRHFATPEDIARETAHADIDAALRLLANHDLDDETAERIGSLCPQGGPVIYCAKDGTQQVIADDSHSVMFASTGRGKTRRYIYPLVYSDVLARTNLVVNDMKGEIYKTCGPLLRRMGYKVYVIDLRNPASSPNRFNPLSIAWHAWHNGDADKAFVYLRSFALSLFDALASNTDDAYWTGTASDYFVGLCLAMLECDAPLEEFTIKSVAAMDHEGEERATEFGSTLKLKEFWDSLPPESLARHFLSGTVSAPEGTKSTIMSVFRSPLSLYSGQRGLMDALGWSDFDVADLARDRRALFVISPDETHSLGPVVVGILNQIMSSLISVAQDEYDGMLPHRVDFVLDEMGNLPARIPDMEALISASRSRNMRFHIVLQSASQLENVYGKQLREVILDNCSTWVYMGSRGLDFLRQISELAGTVTLESGETRPLLSIDKLQHLEKRDRESEALVFVSSLKPYVTALRDIGTYPQVEDVPEKPVPAAVRQPLANAVFSITAVVEEAKKRKLAEALEREGLAASEDAASDDRTAAGRALVRASLERKLASSQQREPRRNLHPTLRDYFEDDDDLPAGPRGRAGDATQTRDGAQAGAGAGTRGVRAETQAGRRAETQAGERGGASPYDDESAWDPSHFDSIIAMLSEDPEDESDS